MKRYLIILCITFFSINSFSQEDQTPEITTYYFIRHAEKDRSNPSEKDPHLTGEGHKRAQDWSDVFGNITFDAVYSTNYYRTKETAQPTAAKNRIEIAIYDPRTGFDADFKKMTEGKTVLIVGHSNTIPSFVNAVIGNKKYQNIDDDNNGNLYIVTIADGIITDLVLTIN